MCRGTARYVGIDKLCLPLDPGSKLTCATIAANPSDLAKGCIVRVCIRAICGVTVEDVIELGAERCLEAVTRAKAKRLRQRKAFRSSTGIPAPVIIVVWRVAQRPENRRGEEIWIEVLVRWIARVGEIDLSMKTILHVIRGRPVREIVSLPVVKERILCRRVDGSHRAA